jgi:hypothetical protein
MNMMPPMDFTITPEKMVPVRRRTFEFDGMGMRQGQHVSLFREVLEDYPKHRRAGGASTTPPSKAPEPVEAKPDPLRSKWAEGTSEAIKSARDEAINEAFSCNNCEKTFPPGEKVTRPRGPICVGCAAANYERATRERREAFGATPPCDCGAVKSKTTHANWCATNG